MSIEKVNDLVVRGKAKLVPAAVQEALDAGCDPNAILNDGMIAAIRYAEANGASICNLSFCSGVYSQELADTIQNSGMLFVVAAGNGDENGIGLNIDQIPAYPASLPFPNVITVSNLMFDGNLDTSSNFGPESADIAAPGSYIVSTIPGGYGFLSGTSMSAPMVTGAAALLLDEFRGGKLGQLSLERPEEF